VQAQGQAAIEAAEEETKRLNQAYSEIGRQRAVSAGKRVAASAAYDRVAAPPVTAGDAMHRARAALDFAESLVERWQRHVRAVRSSLGDAQAAANTAIERGRKLAELKARSVVAKESIAAAAAKTLDVRLVAPARRAAESAELVAQGDRSRPKVMAQLERLVQQVSQALVPDPGALGDAIIAAREAAQSELNALSKAVHGRPHLLRDIRSAAQRAREAGRTARRRLDEFERVVDLAAEIVERGVVLAGIAVGLSKVERGSAEGADAQALAALAQRQARTLRDRAETLYTAQERASADAIRAREQLNVSEGLAQQAKRVAGEAQTDSDLVEVGTSAAKEFASTIGPAQLAQVDKDLRDLLDRTRLAAGI